MKWITINHALRWLFLGILTGIGISLGIVIAGYNYLVTAFFIMFAVIFLSGMSAYMSVKEVKSGKKAN